MAPCGSQSSPETQHTQFKNKRWRYFLGSRRSAHPAKRRRRRQTNTTTTCMIPGIVAHHFAIAGFPSGVALATSPIQMVQTKRKKEAKNISNPIIKRCCYSFVENFHGRNGDVPIILKFSSIYTREIQGSKKNQNGRYLPTNSERSPGGLHTWYVHGFNGSSLSSNTFRLRGVPLCIYFRRFFLKRRCVSFFFANLLQISAITKFQMSIQTGSPGGYF